MCEKYYNPIAEALGISKGAERIHKLNELLKEMSLEELKFLYEALPSIIRFKEEDH